MTGDGKIQVCRGSKEMRKVKGATKLKMYEKCIKKHDIRL